MKTKRHLKLNSLREFRSLEVAKTIKAYIENVSLYGRKPRIICKRLSSKFILGVTK